ncbi:hypothetical protein OX284_005225 [Flavobacterium sp. SUN046]|jgi:hypothetical protein|nr:hypothetical protein [Flavobacterium sp. SUN046]MEC4048820.1 hypothetical protein [Flavobacterium sp. SUN046]
MNLEKALKILNKNKLKKYTSKEAQQALEFITVLAKISIKNVLNKRYNE